MVLAYRRSLQARSSTRTARKHKMTKSHRTSHLRYGLAFAALLLGALPLSANSASSPRTVLSADADWKFFLGDPAGAELATFDDQSWRTVTVPHDWSIEGAPVKDNPAGADGGYFPTGIGWYRKAFTAPSSWKGKQGEHRV